MSSTDKKSLIGGGLIVVVVVLLAVYVSDSPVVTYDEKTPSGEVSATTKQSETASSEISPTEGKIVTSGGTKFEVKPASELPPQTPIEDTEAYKALIKQAETQLANAKEGEKEIIEAQMRLAKLFSGKSIDKGELRLLFKESIDAMMQYKALHPDDFAVQIKVAHSLFAASASGPALGIDTQEYLDKSIELGRELTVQFPNEVRSFAQLGFMLHQTRKPEHRAEAIAAFEKCLEIQADSRFCTGGLKAAKEMVSGAGQ